MHQTIKTIKMKNLINKLISLKAQARNCWDINELDLINAEIARLEHKIKNIRKIIKANQ